MTHHSNASSRGKKAPNASSRGKKEPNASSKFRISFGRQTKENVDFSVLFSSITYKLSVNNIKKDRLTP